MLQVLCHETRILVYAQNKMQTHRVSWQWEHNRWLASFVRERSLVEGTVNMQIKPRWPFMQIFSKTRNPSIICTKQFLLLWYSITGHRFNPHLVFLSFVKNLFFLILKLRMLNASVEVLVIVQCTSITCEGLYLEHHHSVLCPCLTASDSFITISLTITIYISMVRYNWPWGI